MEVHLADPPEVVLLCFPDVVISDDALRICERERGRVRLGLGLERVRVRLWMWGAGRLTWAIVGDKTVLGVRARVFICLCEGMSVSMRTEDWTWELVLLRPL